MRTPAFALSADIHIVRHLRPDLVPELDGACREEGKGLASRLVYGGPDQCVDMRDVLVRLRNARDG